jgi:NAD(P)-dependent dehydrogenase (short-subunit alcohol dehydrogenase family)
MADQTLRGKTALVTGGAGGLGLAIATKFLQAGANVVICDINQERVDETTSRLADQGTLRGYTTDVTSQDQVKNLFANIVGEFGALDILINNAGIMDRFDPVGDLDPALWDRVIAVNLTAPFRLSREAVKVFLAKDTPDGYILNIISMAGKVGQAAGE